MEVSTPAAISSGIEAWTWVISEKTDIEIALMTELLASWTETIRQEKGMFSTSMKYAFLSPPVLDADPSPSYADPFLSPVGYSPTEKDEIDRETSNARRLLSPHALVIKMLLSRLQAARYRRPGLMFILQQLVLRSARAHKTMRCARSTRVKRMALTLTL